jgi:L-2-hydroxyglutarate oxidase
MIPMSEQPVDIVIIGGGIVGLSTAMHLTRSFPKLRLLLLEKEAQVATHQSGHNSGVIHSGIYYKPGSLKAKLCVEGAAAMVEFCREHNLPYKITGKVIVAVNDAEIPRLHSLMQRGQANGIPGLRMLQRGELHELEPHCSGVAWLLVPGTGITDYRRVCEKYAEIIAAQGGQIRTAAEVTGISCSSQESIVETTQGEFRARYLINCAGLYSDRISRMANQKPTVQIARFAASTTTSFPAKSIWSAA